MPIRTSGALRGTRLTPGSLWAETDTVGLAFSGFHPSDPQAIRASALSVPSAVRPNTAVHSVLAGTDHGYPGCRGEERDQALFGLRLRRAAGRTTQFSRVRLAPEGARRFRGVGRPARSPKPPAGVEDPGIAGQSRPL